LNERGFKTKWQGAPKKKRKTGRTPGKILGDARTRTVVGEMVPFKREEGGVNQFSQKGGVEQKEKS